MSEFISTEQMYKVMDQMLNRVEVTEEGPGVEEFKRDFAKDMETAKRNGWVIEIPFEMSIKEPMPTPLPDDEEEGDITDENQTT